MGRAAGLGVVLVGFLVAFACGVALVDHGHMVIIAMAAALSGVLATTVWRRGGANLGTRPNTAPNWVLIALPTGLASSSISLAFGAGAAAIGMAASVWLRPQITGIRLTWACAILPAVALFIVLRPNYPATVFNLIFVVLACAAVALAVPLSRRKTDALVSLVDGVGLFLVVSLVLWFVGFAGKSADRTVGLDNSLIGGQRVIFPLSTSLAATPGMAAVFIATVIPILIVYPKYRILRFIAVACAVAVMILSDSRVSLLGAVLLSGCVLLIPRFFRVVSPWLVGLLLFVPFVYPLIQAGVAALSSAVPWLTRADEQAGTLARRDFIWSQSREFYATRIDWFHQAFGYGSFGHAKSGASGFYYGHFGGLGADARLVTPHSSTLQILFDGGWVTVAVLAGTVIYLALSLSRQGSPTGLAGLAMLVALAIVGITEVALSPSHAHAQPTLWVLVLLATIVFSREAADSAEIGPESGAHRPATIATRQAGGSADSDGLLG